MTRIKIEDLLSAESEVLREIAADLEGYDPNKRGMAGHNSTRTGHNSTGTHSSHSSGVTSAKLPHAKDE